MKICLAPMDWITDCAYRIICKKIFEQFGNPDDELMLWTEFMSADWYFHNPAWVVKHLVRSDYDNQTIAQIFWWNPETLIYCALDIQEKYDFAWIELNMGCPSPKIMKCEAWSWMLKDKAKTLWILKELSEKLTLPFSLKTRIWLSIDDVKDQFEFLLEASKYVWTIWVHGRTYKQSHAWFVDRDFMYWLKEKIPETIIIWNGWLSSYQDCVDKKNNLDWMMPAQRAIWNPWILTPHIPSIQDRFDCIKDHLDLMVAAEIYFKQHQDTVTKESPLRQPTYQELQWISEQVRLWTIDTDSSHSPIEFRKYLFRYVQWLSWNKELKKAIPQAKKYCELVPLLNWYFHSLLST